MKPEEQKALEGLFAELPVLKDLYDVRVRFKEIFDVRLLPGVHFPLVIGFEKDTINGTFVLPRGADGRAG